eukprot:275837_1
MFPTNSPTFYEGIAFAQFERYQADTIYNSFTSVGMEKVFYNRSLSLSPGGGISFEYPGVYEITVYFRPGSGGESHDYAYVRLIGSSNPTVVGASGAGTSGSNAGYGTSTYIFLVEITNIIDAYMLQIVRQSTTMTIPNVGAAFADIGHSQISGITILVEYIGQILSNSYYDGLGFAQFERYQADTINVLPTGSGFDNVIFNKNVSLAGNKISFDFTGIYKITAYFRAGNGGQANGYATYVRLMGVVSYIVVGSSGIGSSGNNAHFGLNTYSFLVNIEDVDDAYVFQIARSNAGSFPITIPGTTFPNIGVGSVSTITVLVKYIGQLGVSQYYNGIAFGQFERYQADTINAEPTNVGFENVVLNKSVSLAPGGRIRFEYTGIYKITAYFRAGSDPATQYQSGMVRLIGVLSTDVVGHSGSGNSGGQAIFGLTTYVFLAEITDTYDAYVFQIARNNAPSGGSIVIAGAGNTFQGIGKDVVSCITVVVEYVGQL